ncbi:MAG: hypothetical protein KJ072_09100 [Verrucomicrobia bacterium]|nr:hypothetical protein [Verrucomicrobiota bacterium]
MLSSPELGLVPAPAELRIGQGVFRVTPQTQVVARGQAIPKARQLIDALAPAMSYHDFGPTVGCGYLCGVHLELVVSTPLCHIAGIPCVKFHRPILQIEAGHIVVLAILPIRDHQHFVRPIRVHLHDSRLNAQCARRGRTSNPTGAVLRIIGVNSPQTAAV